MRTASSLQLKFILKTLTKDQLQTIVEIIYNVVQGLYPVSVADKKKLNRYKSTIRKLFEPRLSRIERKRTLIKLKNIIPVFLNIYINNGSRTRRNSENEI